MAQNTECVARTWLLLALTASLFLLCLRTLRQAVSTFSLNLVGGTITGTVAKFAGAPIAGIVSGMLAAGAAFPIVLSKHKIPRLEPQMGFNEMLASM